jgi:hypothetical protein
MVGIPDHLSWGGETVRTFLSMALLPTLTVSTLAVPPAGVQIVPSPNVGEGVNELFGVTAAAPGRAFAVGAWSDKTGTRRRTMALRSTGTAWEVMDTPNATLHSNLLYAAAHVPGTDTVWAVGTAASAQGYPAAPTDTLILQYDGAAWRQVGGPPPITPAAQGELWGVTAFSPASAVAVGHRRAELGRPAQTLVAEWKDGVWRTVPSPNPHKSNRLFGVAGAGPADLWAVGSGGPSGAERPLVLRGVNGAWQEVPVAGVNEPGVLNAVAVVGSNAWAVGSVTGPPVQPLLLHSNGVAWQRIPLPRVPNGIDLTGVSASSLGTDLWVSGYAWRPARKGPDTFLGRVVGTEVIPCRMPEGGGPAPATRPATAPSGRSGTAPSAVVRRAR